MKRIESIYAILTAAILTLAACTSDDMAEPGEGQQIADGTVKVHLRVSAADGTGSTRAWVDDANAVTKEMMNIWTVVAVNNADDKVVGIYACKPSGEPDQEIDDVIGIATGTYRFYSFANMSPKKVKEFLGIPATDADNAIINSNTPNNIIYSIDFAEGTTVTAASVAAKTVNVAGNDFNPEATDNGFETKGIPMSNVQTITVKAEDNIDLIVIRMLAKIELQVYNNTGAEVKVESLTLTDITSDNGNNLLLLPRLTEGANTMNYIHGDIQPNLGAAATTADMTISPNATVSTAANYQTSGTSGTPVTFTFYVNESARPTNAYQRFFLKIKLEGDVEQRYALIDDANATGYTGSWDYIARNDYRIIPIVLDDYKFDIIPYDFPAIGVFPASVKEEDGLYTISFHDYGHFHLVPKVTEISTGNVVSFTATTPAAPYTTTSWGLMADSFNSSWSSWTDVTKATAATDDGSFYRTGTESYITTDKDGDEVGGFPKWYANTSSPQWDPAGGTNYSPFIFGYIADPGEALLAADKTIYHEFSIYLHKQGMSAQRLMTYRLLMILDQDQMSYVKSHSGIRKIKRH